MNQTPSGSNTIQPPQTLGDRLAILELSGEQKSETATKIITEINDIGIAYWSMMSLSVVIATFGLMIDATAVVIGAMLIAPILSPLEGIAFATTTGNKKLFLQSFLLLLLSVIVGIGIAVIISLIIPPFQITTEILSRTQPTLIDLGIALASGLIAFLSFGYTRIQGSLAGVAMAAALVPPLGVVGIGIGLLDWSIAWGSFLLFVTNLVAIILTGVIIFYLFGFYPTQKDDQKRSLRNMLGALGILAVLCIPLASTLGSIKNSIIQERRINSTIQSYLISQESTTTLQTFEYEGSTLRLELQSPADDLLTALQQSELTTLLAEQLNTDLDVTVSITPRYSATPLDALQPSREENTQTTVQEFLDQFYPSVEILTSEIGVGGSTLLLGLYTDEKFDTSRARSRLLTYLQEANLDYTTLLIQRLESPTALTTTDQRTRTIQGLFGEYFSADTTLQSLQVFEPENGTDLEITVRLQTTNDQLGLTQNLFEYQKRLEEVFETSTKLIPNIQYYETIAL